ncbi:MAG: YeeE/YedE thiosulfate transporter family protein [Kofleriaceae bacterium]
MHDFTPVHAAVGGVLIALGLAVMLIGTGRIAGLSGIVAGLISPHTGGERSWRFGFLAGALAVGAIFELAVPSTYDAVAPHGYALVAGSGLLVGVGTRLANGCTSGHGLCGLARLSKRSLIATVTFLVIAGATATLTGRLV